jgi:hypothetical protein
MPNTRKVENFSRGRLLVAAGVVVAVLTALASCSSNASPQTRRSTASVGAATAPSTPKAATTSASPKAAAAPAIARCRTADLAVSVRQLDAAMSTTYYDVILANRSTHPCRTGGYGGISLVGGGNGTQIGAPATRDSASKPVAITLQPGRRAHARLGVGQALNYPKKKCDPVQAEGVRVYPPNETRSAYVALAVTACRSTKVSLMSLQPYRPIG